MRVYWATKRVPELAGLSACQSKRVLRECHYASGGFLSTVFLVIFLVSFLGSQLVHRLNHDPGFGETVFLAGLCMVLTGLLARAFRLERLRPRIRHYLEQYSDDLKTN